MTVCEAAVRYANMMRARKVLVICNSAEYGAWREAIRDLSEMQDPFIYPVVARKFGINTNAAWTLISPGIVRHPALQRALARIPFDLALVAETSNLVDTWLAGQVWPVIPVQRLSGVDPTAGAENPRPW